MNNEQKLNNVLTRFAGGEVDHDQALAVILALGVDPADAEEMLHLAGGGDDVAENTYPTP